MKIIISQPTPSSPATVIDVAEQWLRKEAADLIPERGVTPGGLPFVAIEQIIDGIAITTRFHAEEIEGGSILEFQLRMRGLNFPAKVRNLGMLPMRRIVRKASIEQFQEIIGLLDEKEQSL